MRTAASSVSARRRRQVVMPLCPGIRQSSRIDVGVLAQRDRERLGAVGGLEIAEARLLERRADVRAEARVVVDHQHGRLTVHAPAIIACGSADRSRVPART